ncbi:LysR family transcriptional regulator [Nevskia ramosa]|uniref:LysR family transcriptional regulator n=1 Tax=Nevskia ramosa TaxID=64002 RepID=UPI0003B6A821|nr:LysR family transcriptional regulator [Nevskia ramosa]
MALARTSLEQWAVLAAVIDHGGYAQAAAALNKSQPAVSYAIARLQEALDVPLLVVEGRKAVLTEHGRVLLQRARPLLREVETLELLARKLKQGWEPDLRLVVDVAFPRELLMNIVAELQQLCPSTQMQVSDAVLSGAEQAIEDSTADVVITTRVPQGFLGDFLMDIGFVAVASPNHPLFEVEVPLTVGHLARHVQVVVRDSGQKHPRNEGWLGADRRCTVSSIEASLATVKAGLGYAWLPEHLLAPALREGTVRPLPLAVGSLRNMELYLVLVRPELAGPAARAAAECFQRHVPVVKQ